MRSSGVSGDLERDCLSCSSRKISLTVRASKQCTEIVTVFDLS